MDRKIGKVQELVREIRVGDVMKADVITVSPQSPMSEFGRILKEKRISGTPVVDEDKLVGIISIDDFIRWLAGREPDCPICQKMTKDVHTLYADERVIHAVNRFDQLGFGRFAVIDRRDKKLVGIITKGDIVEGLLKKLELDYCQEQANHYTGRLFFDDISADRTALSFQYSVTGNDFDRAGEHSSRLKSTLQRLGLAPQIVRRAAIATYEAEMNLIIYTKGGQIRVRVDPRQILVRVEDSGPGIPDVEKALQPGYSTAPEWVRELGFGAGMGLQNIRNCASRMGLKSAVGKGTRLRINISINDGDSGETN
ncbi:MAG: CBS domain-containing protein [Planctomycetota bacterium]|jgi:CBS domain-containing protein/anti-sigma regulatory factor (Ser/Thr protein kinase)